MLLDRWNGSKYKVDHRSKVVGGALRIETSDGYVLPFCIDSGLVYMHFIQVPTDADLQQFSHVFFTSPDIGMLLFWTMVLHMTFLRKFTKKLTIPCSQIRHLMNLGSSPVSGTVFGHFLRLNLSRDWEHNFDIHLHKANPTDVDWKSLRPYFEWQSEQLIQNTYKVTSRFGGTIHNMITSKKNFKPSNTVFNIPRRNEPVATDTIFSDTPAINHGRTVAQFVVGKDTLECDAYGIKSQKQFINTLYDNIKTRGAMDTIITAKRKCEMSKKVAPSSVSKQG